MCKTKTPKDRSAEIAAQQEAERQARIKAGSARIDEIFGGFDDNYYDGIAGAYKEHYTPLLEEQYEDARKQLYYNPAGGSTSSSAFAERLADLEKERQRQLVELGNRGLATAQENRGNLANNRQSLISQLNAGASVDTVAGLAAEQAKTLTATPVYSPLGDLFSRYLTNGANVLNSGVISNQQNNDPLLFGNTNKKAATVVGF